MSNRILALIILISIIGIFIGGYFYFFVFYGSTVQFNGNIPGFSVSLSSDTLKRDLNYRCEELSCSYENIPPLDFRITVSKEGYDSYTVVKKIPGKGDLAIDFSLKKTVVAEEIVINEIAPADVVEQKKLRVKYRNFFSYYDFGDKGVFYLREYLGKLFLYRDKGEEEILIYDFEKVSPNKIHMSEIYNTDYFTIYIDGINYLFHNSNNSFRSLNLKKKIEYGKKGKANELLLTTDVGTYVHDLKSRKSEYYYPFTDIVYLEDREVLGLLLANDENKRKNLSMRDKKLSQVVRYNLDTKDVLIVYETAEEISQMYLYGAALRIRIAGKLKELQNY